MANGNVDIYMNRTDATLTASQTTTNINATHDVDVCNQTHTHTWSREKKLNKKKKRRIPNTRIKWNGKYSDCGLVLMMMMFSKSI